MRKPVRSSRRPSFPGDAAVAWRRVSYQVVGVANLLGRVGCHFYRARPRAAAGACFPLVVTEDVIDGDGFRLRRAEPRDAGYLANLAAHDDVYPFLAAISPWRDEILESEIARSNSSPLEVGRFVLEVEDEGNWLPAGGAAFEVANQRSRIASLYGVMVDPEHRGRGLGASAVRALSLHLLRTAGYHRIQLEVYGFNEGGLRLFECAGFLREGTKRKAYWRRDRWNDAALFGLVREDLGLSDANLDQRS